MDISDERKDTGKSAVGGLVKKLKGIKNIQIIAVIFIIAVALIIYSTVMTSKQKGNATASVSTVMTSDEQRLSSILSNIDGAGRVEAMITMQDGRQIGVLVIADGADSITVRLRLIDATATALGVDKSIVNVFSRK
ncbi:MAG: hypothetical protein K2M36_05300 [Clostridia bacterium]|nr:hypothetical protein [Clostridia bacterium]